MASLKEEVGNLIRHHRRQRGWSQDQLAEKTSRSVEMINRIERGRTAPSFDTLEALASSLDVPVRELFGAGQYAVGSADDALTRIISRLSPLDQGDLEWVDRLLSVALGRKVRAR